MEYYIFTVWDFMSLLKSLQKNLTCTSVPWLPTPNAETRYFINETVLGLESDVDYKGNRASHFELFMQAMTQAGCKKDAIRQLLEDLRGGMTVTQALYQRKVPRQAAVFVNHTFSYIISGKLHIQAAVFLYGREGLLPDDFIERVSGIKDSEGGSMSLLKYYAQHSAQGDWAHNSFLGDDLITELCSDNNSKWDDAAQAVKDTLAQRLLLLDAVVAALPD